jgi:hypothetical protein
MSEINPGDVVRVSTTPGFKDLAGTLTDPTTVTLRWAPHRTDPAQQEAATTTWVYGTDVEVVRDSVGLFHADIPVTEPGLHHFTWAGMGAVVAVEPGDFRVEPDPLAVSP